MQEDARKLHQINGPYAQFAAAFAFSKISKDSFAHLEPSRRYSNNNTGFSCYMRRAQAPGERALQKFYNHDVFRAQSPGYMYITG